LSRKELAAEAHGRAGEKSGMNSTVEKILVLLLTNHLPDNCTRTSKQIGLTIPPNVLARADKLIK